MSAVRRVAATMTIASVVALSGFVTPQSASAVVGDTYFPVAGAGSSWSSNALQQWVRNVFDNFRWKVTFDASGSSAGRQQFAQGTVDFAVSEIPYALAGSDSPDPRPARQFAYVPIVAGGTAFMYNLVIGGQRVTNLRLSGETVAKIFTGAITKWNDPAIAADNPKLGLPAIQIVPVVRSDGSGTTAQLTSWMRDQYPSVWNAYCQVTGRANCGITSNYPIAAGSAFIGQQGSDGVAGFVAQNRSVGAITYVESSFAKNARFPVAKVLNSAGFYTEPTASNVAVSLLAAVINSDPTSPDYLTAQLNGVYTNPDPRVYPLSSYSYIIVPTAIEGSFTANKGLTLADFASYFLCEGQQQADVLGYSPLPVNLAAAGLSVVQEIPGGNPINKNISSCNNPTFSPDGSNKLAQNAPQPAECDRRGPDQCLTGTGGASDTQTPASSATSGSGSSSSSSSLSNSVLGAGDQSLDAASAAAGSSGLTVGGVPVVAGLPITIPDRGVPNIMLIGMLIAAAAVFVLTLLPPLMGWRRTVSPAADASIATVENGAKVQRRLQRLASKVHPRSVFSKRARAQVQNAGS